MRLTHSRVRAALACTCVAFCHDARRRHHRCVMSVCEAHVCSTAAAPDANEDSGQQRQPQPHAFRIQFSSPGAASDATERAPAAPAAANSYRAVLGRSAWMVMHEMASNLPCARDLPLFYDTVRGLVHLYPCSVCRENAVLIIDSAPFATHLTVPDTDEEARRAARSFVNAFHAAVTTSVIERGGYVSARSAELARLYLAKPEQKS